MKKIRPIRWLIMQESSNKDNSRSSYAWICSCRKINKQSNEKSVSA